MNILLLHIWNAKDHKQRSFHGPAFPQHFAAHRSFLRVTVVIVMLLITGCLSMTANAQAPTGKLIITFTNIRSNVGIIALGLYDEDAQWTDEPLCAYHWDKEEMRNGCLTVEIDSLPRKRYACAVLDDEDRSLSMRFTIGLPREGWGMSSNPSFFKLKKPGFEDVAFDLDCPVLRMEIKINYLNKNKNVE